MIDITEAISIVLSKAYMPDVESIPTWEAEGRVVAEDVFSPADSPFFNQSAVDGVALMLDFSGAMKKNEFTLIGEVRAGDNKEYSPQPYEAVKIYTGAKVPEGFNTVVMKEYLYYKDKTTVIVPEEYLLLHRNIRFRGEEVRKGEKIFARGEILTPRHIAAMVSLGIRGIKVFKKLSIGLLITGNELKDIRKHSVKEGEKFESNGLLLQLLLKKYCDIQISYVKAKDTPEEIENKLDELIRKNEIVITTGGVSVGDYDYTKSVLSKIGARLLIDKVAQKPGKPFLLAEKEKVIVFALPGNPRAVASCWYVYVLPFLQRCMQVKIREEWVEAMLEDEITLKDGRAHIMFVNHEKGKVRIPQKQDSHMLISSAQCNGITIITQSQKKGAIIRIKKIE